MSVHSLPDNWTVNASVWIIKGVYAATLRSDTITRRADALKVFRTVKRRLGSSLRRIALCRTTEEKRAMRPMKQRRRS